MIAPRVVVLMGVSGSGKTTVGSLLARRFGGFFHDADDYHPQGNVDKMAQGHPLNDDDRLPWLLRLRNDLIDPAPVGKITILACSALKQQYREILGLNQTGVATVFLCGEVEILRERLNSRKNHYMKPGMLASQLEILEAPSNEEALHISISSTPEEIITKIGAEFHFKV